MKKQLILKFHNERGTAAVEFAILLPILIILLFGIIEFGRVYNAYITVTHAAREGARLAAVRQYDEATVADRAAPLTPVIVQKTGGGDHGDTVEVRVSYTYQLNVPFWKTENIPISSTARMRVE